METPIKKNEHYEVEISDIGTEGQGIGKINGFTVFVPDTVTGDVCEVRIVKEKKHYAYGKLMTLKVPSPLRKEAICSVAHQCGGCQIQHVDYKAQLDWKTQKVKGCLEHIGGFKDMDVLPTLGMENPFYYRNKAQYPIRLENSEVKIGFFAPRSHRIVAADTCHIQDEHNKTILEKVKAFLVSYNISIYNEEMHKGLVRHLVIKSGFHTNELMVCLVINGRKLPHSEALVKTLKIVPHVKSIILNHHLEKSNVILGKENTVLEGEAYIIDQIGDLKFMISPLSFFQVNPYQTEVLYRKALEFADLKGEEIVWDAYCGIGTISLFLAQRAKKVYGVEIVPQAIEDAKKNAALNGLTNTEFFTGKAEEIIPALYEKGVKADVIIVDPPRKGCDEKLLQTLKNMAPQKIVYVSCDPATLARDLAYLANEADYKIEKVQPVDMFPHTVHVETVVLMSRKDK